VISYALSFDGYLWLIGESNALQARRLLCGLMYGMCDVISYALSCDGYLWLMGKSNALQVRCLLCGLMYCMCDVISYALSLMITCGSRWRAMRCR
jgi:hypothetical protein